MLKPLCLVMFRCAALMAQVPTMPEPPHPFAVGNHWRGKTVEDQAMKNLRVIERTGDMVVFEAAVPALAEWSG